MVALSGFPRVLLAGAIAAAALMALVPSAADGGTGKSSRDAELSVRLKTASHAKALRTNKLRVRVVVRRATQVRLIAKARKPNTAGDGRRAKGSLRIVKQKAAGLQRRKGRTVSLRLNRRGRRLFDSCAGRRVTVVARDLRRPGLKARGSRSLRLDHSRCPAIRGCAAANPPGGEWPFYSGTLDGHREQLKEKSIDKGNVAELGVAWRARTPDGGVIHSTPVVADGCVYTGTDLGNAHALNADTGELVWSRALGEGGEGSNTFEGAGIVGSPAVADGLVYVGATTPQASVLSALDQATGKVVWKRVVDEDEGGGLDSSPVPFKGMVFQAFKGDEASDHSNPGFAIVDGSRKKGGKILVKTHTIPPEDFAAGYRGGSIINTPAVDLKQDLVFAGTGNPVSERQHPLTNALLKIGADPSSPSFGKILASHRGTSDSHPAPVDVDSPACQTTVQWPIGRFSCAQFDFNFLSSPNLWTNSDGRQMFGGLQKSGVYTAVYTDTMERAWQATLGLPCFACNLSSTAVDENAIYVAVSGGNLYALDRDTGGVKWATPVTGTLRYNGVAVANGIVYSLNDATGTLQAFDASNGAQLFSHPFSQDTGEPMNDMGNSSGVSVARNTVFATSQANGTSTLFALKLGATGGGEPPPSDEQPPEEQPPPPEGGDSGEAVIATGPGAASYGYLTPIVTINKGGKVSYTNVDPVRHNVSSTKDGLFRSELANSGDTVPVAGTETLEPGTYEFYCEPHPNMKGQLEVR